MRVYKKLREKVAVTLLSSELTVTELWVHHYSLFKIKIASKWCCLLLANICSEIATYGLLQEIDIEDARLMSK